MVGFAMAALMVASFVAAVIYQIQREVEKYRAKGPRIGSLRPARKSVRQYRALSGRNIDGRVK